MTQLLDTVARFVEQGGTLIVEAKPDPPVGFDRMEYLLNPGADLVSVLGLKATLHTRVGARHSWRSCA